jgi:adenosylhomocysteine nucleosidase
MKIGIIGAMAEEVENLIEVMAVTNKEDKSSMKFYEGDLWGHKVVVVTCGIGKVNAAVCSQVMIDRFKVDRIINVGIAGGLREDIYPGDIVVADSLVQHDVDTSFFGDRLGQIPRLNVFDFLCDESLVAAGRKAVENLKDANAFVGRIVSGDQFIHEASKLIGLKETFDAYACEMEGAAIGQVCHLNKVPFVVIRSISDNAINGSHMDYDTFSKLAIKHSTALLKDMLLHL